MSWPGCANASLGHKANRVIKLKVAVLFAVAGSLINGNLFIVIINSLKIGVSRFFHYQIS